MAVKLVKLLSCTSVLYRACSDCPELRRVYMTLTICLYCGLRLCQANLRPNMGSLGVLTTVARGFGVHVDVPCTDWLQRHVAEAQACKVMDFDRRRCAQAVDPLG
jgi:hypothetical protein